MRTGRVGREAVGLDMSVPVQLAQPMKQPWLNQKHDWPFMPARLACSQPASGSPQLHALPLAKSEASKAFRARGETRAPWAKAEATEEASRSSRVRGR